MLNVADSPGAKVGNELGSDSQLLSMPEMLNVFNDASLVPVFSTTIVNVVEDPLETERKPRTAYTFKLFVLSVDDFDRGTSELLLLVGVGSDDDAVPVKI